MDKWSCCSNSDFALLYQFYEQNGGFCLSPADDCKDKIKEKKCKKLKKKGKCSNQKKAKKCKKTCGLC